MFEVFKYDISHFLKENKEITSLQLNVKYYQILLMAAVEAGDLYAYFCADKPLF